MTPEELAEIAMCDECISHLLENAGPDHIVIKYRAALIKVARLEAAYLKAYYAQIYNGSRLFGINYTDDEINQKAHESLERVRRGEQP